MRWGGLFLRQTRHLPKGVCDPSCAVKVEYTKVFKLKKNEVNTYLHKIRNCTLCKAFKAKTFAVVTHTEYKMDSGT